MKRKERAISVNILAKDCRDNLKTCLESLKGFLRPELGDEVLVLDTGSRDDTPEVAERLGARVIRRPDLSPPEAWDIVKEKIPEALKMDGVVKHLQNGFLTDFAAARSILVKESKNDLISWIDSDDVLVGGKEFREFCASHFARPESSIVYIPYDYGHDEHGECTTRLWRERVIDRRHHHWKGICHETMLPSNGVIPEIKQLNDPGIRIVHKSPVGHLVSNVRNYAIMIDAYEKAEWKDPRLELYLGNACRGLGRNAEAVRWYRRHLKRSGSPDDRYNAQCDIGVLAMISGGRYWAALDEFFLATKIKVEDPRAYVYMAKCHYHLKRWQDALHWASVGQDLPPPATALAYDPLDVAYAPLVIKVNCWKELGEAQRTMLACEEILQRFPNYPPARRVVENTEKWIREQKMKALTTSICELTLQPKDRLEIIQRIRPEVKLRYPELQIETCATNAPCVTFICRHSAEPWDGTNIADGIGGSERMVILLGEGLAKKGWNVEVYGKPKKQNNYKKIRGVTWRPWESFNPAIERDRVILWRDPGAANEVRAKKVFVDLHDVSSKSAWEDARLNKRLSGIFWKSKFHRSTAPGCPEHLCIYSRNALDPKLAEIQETRNPKKVVWSSSADRGIQTALAAWSLVKQQIPDAEFHVLYGFTDFYLLRASQREYQHMGDCGCDRHMLDYMEESFRAMEMLRVKYHGRLPCLDVIRHLKQASVWLYPTRFPEISCIAAMEAQACGAIPVCSNTAALAETAALHARFVDPDDPREVAAKVVEVIQAGSSLDEERRLMSEEAMKKFSLDTLVDQWDEVLKKP